MPRTEPAPPASSVEHLAALAESYDSKVRLLFQLRNYISLARFDPVAAKKDKSAEFRRFVNSNHLDLWEALGEKADTRKATKRVQLVRKEVENIRAASGKKKKPAPAPAPTPAPKPTKAAARQKRKASESVPPPPPPKETGCFIIDSDLGWPDQSLPVKRAKHANKITHPIHYVKPAFGGSLGAFLSSYRTVSDENEVIQDEQWEKRVAAESEAYRRVLSAKKNGNLDELKKHGVGTNAQIPKFNPPSPDVPSFYDNMVSQTVHYAKLRANLRKYHQSILKRNSQSVEQYFRRLAGAEDRERKLLERSLKQLARRLGQEVMKKWKLAEKIVEQRRQALLAEEKREKGKEYLNQILDNSAKLIESRIDFYDGESGVENDEEDGDDDEEVDEDLDMMIESEAAKAEDSSRAGSESRSSPAWDHDDHMLTVEELREKYKNLPDLSQDEIDSESDSNSDPESVSSLHDSGLDKPSEEALRIYAETRDDSESVPDSEELSEELSSDEESDKSESASDDDDGRPNLASLFAGAAAVDDDDEEEAKISEAEEELERSEAEEESKEPIEDSPAKALERIPSGDESDEPNNVIPAQIEEEIEHVPLGIEEEAEERERKYEEAEKAGEQDDLVQHRIEPPFLLKGHLREYQRNGLDWLAGLVQSGTNGILADEMGLGKTIQTIALLSWLACEKQIWGPHLIVVPTSVMLNWEMEFKRFAPGFKILTYFGSPQQRKKKRRGWNKEDTWHVCITSYQLVIQDQVVFRGKRWQYMVLDEAHNIKNFRSQRWQALLNFNAQHRLLLTGTPLQNNLVELWSLLYFLMPSTRATQMMPAGFASLDDFQEWFARPVDQMVEEGEEADDEARATIAKLHQVLRPYLLRRLKVDVEKQMPGKYEHVVYCRLSKRQRYLYDDFMSRAATKATLASGNFMSILNCLMQLRKVCNHPDLFEIRPIVTSYAIDKSIASGYGELVVKKFTLDTDVKVDLDLYNMMFLNMEGDAKREALTRSNIAANKELEAEINEENGGLMEAEPNFYDLDAWVKYDLSKRRMRRLEQHQRALYLNKLRTSRVPLYGRDLREKLRIFQQPGKGVLSYEERQEKMNPIITRFAFVTPAVVVLDMPELLLGPVATFVYGPRFRRPLESPMFHESQVRLSVAFPDKRLLQYDCGKLQKLAVLLRDLISNGHRCLIFTQMTRVLDVLEQFLNLHGWRYLRLDGATRIEQRQALTERFNKDPAIPVFILSTRSGGLGINLTGADTVIFYDSDWNPAMDRQCQDRCHRIGQTRDVHIYRLVSEYTIESNILRKATQKTILDNVVIQEGDFTTEYFTRMSVQDILGDGAGRDTSSETLETMKTLQELGGGATKRLEAAMAQTEDQDDQVAANLAMSEARMDIEEFNEPSINHSVNSPALDPTNATELKQERISATPRATPGPSSPGKAIGDAAANQASAGSPVVDDNYPYLNADGVGRLEGPAQVDQGDELEIGHIDDWMIKAIERGLYAY